uniref:Sushi domain-containing protein n=1 Tax=Neogobius melanostomus TaxID=47308 RepID=A0A8C6SYX0_9GOBI
MTLSVTCSKTAENVYSWESSWNRRNTVDIDKTVWYRCYREYKETSPTGRAKCTRRGWEPNPLCKEKPCTTQPRIENGEMLSDKKTQYDHGESLWFRCESERTTFRVTCQSGEWKKEKSCEGKWGNAKEEDTEIRTAYLAPSGKFIFAYT